jgi:hypothetical protein
MASLKIMKNQEILKMSKWFEIGEEGRKKNKANEEAMAIARTNTARRFWLAKSNKSTVTFLDTPEFFFSEHTMKIGQQYSTFTCIQGIDVCPLCLQGERASFVMAGTVIDHSKWTDKQGAVHQNEKKVIVFKGKAKTAILRQIEKYGGDIKHMVFEVERGPETTSAATGEFWEAVRRSKLSPDGLKKLVPSGQTEEWLKPFDYYAVFAPKTSEELRKICGMPNPIGSTSSEDNVFGDDSFEKDDDIEEEPESLDALL